MTAHVPVGHATPRSRGPSAGAACPLAKLGRSSPRFETPRGYRLSPSVVDMVSYRTSPLDPAVYHHRVAATSSEMSTVSLSHPSLGVYTSPACTPSPLEPSVYNHSGRIPPPSPSPSPSPLRGFRSFLPGNIECENFCRRPHQQLLLSDCSSFPPPSMMDGLYHHGRSSPAYDQGYHTLVSPTATWIDFPCKASRKTIVSKIDILPDKVLLRIFSFLDSRELCACARVCRRWSNLVWEPELWHVIKLYGEGVCGDKAVRCILRRLCGQTQAGTVGACASVQRLLLGDGARISDKGLIQLARRCPQLTHLQVHYCTSVTNQAILEITTKCTNLQHLDITGCTRITCLTMTPGPEPPPRLLLQYLDLTDCAAIDDGGLKLIVRNCPQLVYLYLRRCFQITDMGVKFVPSFCGGLRELSVSDCTRVTDFGIHEVAKLGATLRYLSVAKCEQVSDAGLKVIARRCYKLRYLNVRGCEAISDDSLTLIARSCPRLRALDIGKCDVSDAGLRALAEYCPNLKKLSLRSCDLVTDRGVQCIAYYCRGLQQLNIQDCQISIEGYRAVKKYCKRCVIEHSNPAFF